MGKMKSLHLLENCFAASSDIDQENAKQEAITSHLIRANSKLQKVNDQLTAQAKKQEQCITHLLKRLETTTDLATEQQTNFDEAIHRQTATLASMLQELSKSKSEIIQLRTELAFKKTKVVSSEQDKHHPLSNSTAQAMKEVHDDISDEDTVPTNNVAMSKKNASPLNDDYDIARYSMIPAKSQSNCTLQDNGRKTIEEVSRMGNNAKEDGMVRSNLQRVGSESDLMEPTPPLLDMRFKGGGRSGLQEEDIDAPRPPIFRPASGLRGLTRSLIVESSPFQGRWAKISSTALGIDVPQLASTTPVSS